MLNSTVDPPVTSTRPETRSYRIRATRAATDLKPAEKLLLRSLVDFMGNSAECWPSLSRLAAEVGVSVRHVRRMLRSLEAAGWIVSRFRFRSDRSQASCVFTWAKAPDLHVRPPRTSASPLEVNIGKSTSNTYAAPAECDSVSEDKAPAAVVPPARPANMPQLEQELPAAVPAAEVVTPAAPELPVVTQSGPVPAAEQEVNAIDFQTGAPAIPAIESSVSSLPASTAVLSPSKTAIPAIQRKAVSPRFIVIDGSKFLDIREAERVYHAAVAAKLINSGPVDRLAFFSCWCSIVAKLRAGKVQSPERMMRFLLDNRKAMSAYPDHAAELKAREAIRHLFPERPYCPHG